MKSAAVRVAPCLSLEGTWNTRDLGGYETAGGRLTASRRFLRSDSLDAATARDLNELIHYGVRCVVDLRTPAETARRPSPFSSSAYPQVSYHQIPLLDQVQSADFAGTFPASMGKLYCDLLKNSASSLSHALRVLMDADGCALFNCAAGKDRTGVLAMLLLKNAGVSDETILADYAVSENNMREVSRREIKKLRENGVDVPDHVFAADPDNMRMALDFLRESGGVQRYLKSAGFSQRETEVLRERLL